MTRTLCLATCDPIVTGSRSRQPFIALQRQPQQPPPQQPPPEVLGAVLAVDRPPTATATVDRSFTVSSCPDGHVTGSFAVWIDRLISNVSPQ
jgi:hypothetical protein